jgi:hypothetical protein
MDTPDRYDVFISYSHKDLAAAEPLRDYLQQAGKTCWLDTSHITHGQEWWPAILEAIERSACVVCLVSPAFLASPVCRAEAEHARQLKKKLVPVLWPTVAAPAVLAHVKAIPHAPCVDGSEVACLVRAAIDADLDYSRQRRELLTRAVQWEEAGFRDSLVLRGPDLTEAVVLLERCHRDQLATPAQQAFVGAGLRIKRQSLACRAGLAAAFLMLSATVMLTFAASQRPQESASACHRDAYRSTTISNPP